MKTTAEDLKFIDALKRTYINYLESDCTLEVETLTRVLDDLYTLSALEAALNDIKNDGHDTVHIDTILNSLNAK